VAEETAARRSGPVISEAIHGIGKVRIGLTGDYVDLDALVFDLINNIIDPWHRAALEALGFVVIMSRDLNADRLFPLVQTVKPPSDDGRRRDHPLRQGRGSRWCMCPTSPPTRC
jgi:hypothetical protein